MGRAVRCRHARINGLRDPGNRFHRAAVREIVKDKVSGFIVKDGDIKAMAKAVKNINKLKRQEVRDWALNNFSLGQEVKKFEKICYSLIKPNAKK